MAIEGQKIKNLPETEELNDSDDIIVEDATPKTKRITFANIFAQIKSKLGIKSHAYSDLVQNASTDDSTKAVSASVAKGLQDQTTILKNRYVTLNNWGTSGSFVMMGGGHAILVISMNVFHLWCAGSASKGYDLNIALMSGNSSAEQYISFNSSTRTVTVTTPSSNAIYACYLN